MVRRLVDQALDGLPKRPLKVVSMCAGQGRDVIPVLARHPRRHDTDVRLVELDARLARHAREQARRAGLDRVEVVTADAGVTDVYAGAVPADLVLVCGVFGNVVDDDIALTIEQLPRLCAEGGVVLWTRNREPVDIIPKVRHWFAAAGFGEIELVTPPGVTFAVGAHRLLGPPSSFAPGIRLFEFLDERLPGEKGLQGTRPT